MKSKTNVEALKKLYAKFGGQDDMSDKQTIAEMLYEIIEIVTSGGGSGGGGDSGGNFIVSITRNGNTVTTDKTYAEIKEAYDAGKNILGRSTKNGLCYFVTSVSAWEAVFVNLDIGGSTTYAEVIKVGDETTVTDVQWSVS